MIADACHFDGGQTGILADGSVDVVLRDCTMGPGQPSVWFDNARSNVPVFGELRLMHASIMAGSAPVFRFDGTQARVWVDDSVVAPAGRSPATLVMVDNPRNLTCGAAGPISIPGSACTWRLRTGNDRQEPITDFAHWSETPTELRETGTARDDEPGMGNDRPWSSSAGRDRQSHARVPLELGHHFPVRHRGSPGPVWFGAQERESQRKTIQAG